MCCVPHASWCVRPRPSSLASPEDFKLGRAALAGPEEKPERDSRGHGYSWRDLVQRICNLHFKHAPKSVPGRQPRSALTLVAGGPCWCSDIFSFKTEHRHAHTNTHRTHSHPQDSGSGSFYSSPLTDPSPSSFSPRLCFLCFVRVCVNDSTKSWSSLHRKKRSGGSQLGP